VSGTVSPKPPSRIARSGPEYCDPSHEIYFPTVTPSPKIKICPEKRFTDGCLSHCNCPNSWPTPSDRQCYSAAGRQDYSEDSSNEKRIISVLVSSMVISPDYWPVYSSISLAIQRPDSSFPGRPHCLVGRRAARRRGHPLRRRYRLLNPLGVVRCLPMLRGGNGSALCFRSESYAVFRTISAVSTSSARAQCAPCWVQTLLVAICCRD